MYRPSPGSCREVCRGGRRTLALTLILTLTLALTQTLQVGGEMAGRCGRSAPGLPVELEEVTKLREECLARVSM